MKLARLLARSPRLSLWLASLTAAGLLPFGVASLRAQTAATWNGGAGNWSNGSLWSTGGAPNGDAFDVVIDGGKTGTASVVTMDGSYTVGRLTLDAGDTLNLADNIDFDIGNGAFAGGGALVNNGTINFNSTGGGIYLRFNGAGTISGVGTINFNGVNNRVFANTAGGTVTVGAGQTLAGQANLGNGGTNFTNQGTITANQSGNTLTLQPGGNYTFTNTGSGAARAENGGVLELAGGTFTGNSFTALAGSRVQVDSGANVSGATLASVGTGAVTMDNATLTNATLAGNVSASNNSNVVLGGTLTNNGTFTLNSTGAGIYLEFSSAVTLAGTGTINMSGANDRIFATAGFTSLTIGAGQTIAGAGNIGNGGTIVNNQGTITANQSGATLTLQPGGSYLFTTSGNGAARAENGGVLVLNGGEFDGGTFTALAGSQVQVASGTFLSGVSLASSGTGAVTMDNAILYNATLAGNVSANNNATVSFSGTLTNNGTFTLNSTGSGIFLQLASPATLATNSLGALTLVGPNDRVYASNAGDRLTINQNVTVQGVGNLGQGQTTFTNNGQINANVRGGTLTIQPGGGAADFTNAANGSLLATNGGALVFNNGNGGALTNNGTLDAESGSTLTVPASALTNLSGGVLTGGRYLAASFDTNSPATLSVGGGSIVTNNAAVELDGAGAVFNEINALATIGSSGSFVVGQHNFTTAGALTNAGSINAIASTLTVSGALTNSGTAQVQQGGTINVAGNVTNTGLINSQATVAVQGALNNSGRLFTGYAGQSAAITITGILTQTTGGTVFGNGSVTAPSLSLAGSLRPGDLPGGGQSFLSGVGTLTLNGQVGLLGNTAFIFDLGGTAASDRLQVNGALTLDGTLSVNAMSGFGAGRYDLINYTGALTNNTLDLGTLPSGYNYAIDLSRAGEVDLVVASAVPEPSIWTAVLAGSGLLAFALRRRPRDC